MFKIYLHLSNNGIPFYIGKGKGKRPFDLVKRSNEWKKFVKNNGIRVIILQEVETNTDAFNWETKYINIFGRLDKNEGTLLNKTDGGLGSCGAIVSNETKSKLKNINRNFTDSHKKNISVAKTGKKRKPFSQEHKDKISKSILGRKLSDETKNKMKGVKRTDEHKKILSEKQKKYWDNFRKSKL